MVTQQASIYDGDTRLEHYYDMWQSNSEHGPTRLRRVGMGMKYLWELFQFLSQKIPNCHLFYDIFVHLCLISIKREEKENTAKLSCTIRVIL